MSSQIHRLPTRFPVGTRYVIEGQGGHIHLRYLEFPDGRHVDLPARTARTPPRARAARRRRDPQKAAAGKIFSGQGTARGLGR